MDVSVTQGTSTATAVTANGDSGLITCFTSVLAAATPVTFTVNNSATDSDSFVAVGIMNYSGTTGTPIVRCNNCVAGTSFDIVVTNAHASAALNGILKIGFKLF
jgi:hypothetical protein